MNIIIDITHPAHLNFFKPIIRLLKNNNHVIFVTCLRRGRLPMIVQRELKDVDIYYIGHHRGNYFSVIFEANILRFFKFLRFLKSKNIDLGLSFGSFVLGFCLRIFHKPNLQFDDDPERRLNVFLQKISATKLFYPPIIKESDNVFVYNGVKEWLYLSPEIFTPDITILRNYSLLPKQYIFVREVSTGSLNYFRQQKRLISNLKLTLPENFQVILSLENKSNRDKYPSEWILLEEPVDCIHSILYFSMLVISSGDSMAREAALLGIPGIYCGQRIMAVNNLLATRGMFFHLKPEDVNGFIINYLEKQVLPIEQEKYRAKLLNDFINVQTFVCSEIDKFQNLI
jgi:predicted glycosyltransferase